MGNVNINRFICKDRLISVPNEYVAPRKDVGRKILESLIDV